MTPLRRAVTAAVVSAALLVVMLAVPALAQAATPSVSNLCPTATAGHATCYAEVISGGIRPMASAAGLPSGYGPADLQSAYGLPAAPTGAGQTVYIVDAYDAPTAESDLATYRSTYGLPACTTANGCFAKLNQNGAASPLPSYNSGWAGEIALDLDMVSATCPACNIRLIEANDNGGGLYTAVREAVSLGARFVSMSWGGPEFSGETSYDSNFSARGVLFAASTGDNGAGGGPSYPAMSPNVLAVGGTSLNRASNARGWAETAWPGAGSGCSAYEAKPSWQAFIDSATCSRRAGADVSAVADPSTGVAVFNNGSWGRYGGTSASSPIVASIYALAGTPAAGSAPQSFPYENSTAFTDVTSGSTGSCAAALICNSAAGWDGPTGLGTPIGTAAVTDAGTSATPPPPTALGATVSVDASVIPGEAASGTVTPLIPTGRTLKSLSWSSTRSDCAFSAPTGASTTITCSATATGSTTVTVKVTDSAGATKTVSSPMAFTTNTPKRDVELALDFGGQSGSSVSVCTGAATPVAVTATDAVTGAPVKGLSIALTKQAAGAVTATSAGATTTAATGVASTTQSVSAQTTYTVSSTAAGVFNAAGPVTVAVSAARCTTSIAASASTGTAWYGDRVTVTGSVTRPDPSGTGTLPVPGVRVPVTITASGRTMQVGLATTATDGSFTTSFPATISGEVGTSVPASAAYTPAAADLGALTVQLPTTTLTPGTHADEVGYGDRVTIPGTLTATGASTYPLAGQAVSVLLTPAGSSTARVVGSARVAADGSFAALVTASASGTLAVAFAGAAGHPAASAGDGSLTVDAWTPSLQLSASAAEVGYGTPVTFTGSVDRTSTADGTVAAPGLTVKLVLAPSAGGTPVTLSSVTTSSSGAFKLTVAPRMTGTVTAVVTAATGYQPGTSNGVAVTVDPWDLAISASASATSVRAGTSTIISGSVTRSCDVASGVPTGLLLKVYDTPAASGSVPVLIGIAAVASTGTYRLAAYPRVSGSLTVVVARVGGYKDASSAPIAVTVT